MFYALNLENNNNNNCAQVVNKCGRVSSGRPASPLSAKVWIASQALTKMSSSGEPSSSTAVAGVLPSTDRGSNCKCEEGKRSCTPCVIRLHFSGQDERPAWNWWFYQSCWFGSFVSQFLTVSLLGASTSFFPFLTILRSVRRQYALAMQPTTEWPAVMGSNRTDSQTAKLSPHLNISSLRTNRVQIKNRKHITNLIYSHWLTSCFLVQSKNMKMLKDGNRSVDPKFSVPEKQVDTALPSNACYTAPKKA